MYGKENVPIYEIKRKYGISASLIKFFVTYIKFMEKNGDFLDNFSIENFLVK